MRRLGLLIAAALVALAAVPCLATENEAFTALDYDRAAAMFQVGDLVYNESLTPHWIGDEDRFWYLSDDRDGSRFWLVDPFGDAPRRRLAFDHDALAASLSRLRAEPVAALDLPFERIDLGEEGRVRFSIVSEEGAAGYDCRTDGADCREERAEAEPEAAPPRDLTSPDGKRSLRLRDHDLYLVDTSNGSEKRVTGDGEALYDYASRPESSTSAVTERLAGARLPPVALWSPDSSRVLTYRLDQREVEALHLLQTTGLGDGVRPRLHSYRMPFPGDEAVAVSELLIVDAATAKTVAVDTEPVHTPFLPLQDLGQLWWSESGHRAYLLRRPRGARSMSLVEIDPATGATRTLVEESSRSLVEPNLAVGAPPNVRVLATGEVIWFSQRDGWGHLYLYGPEGQLVRQLTHGRWVVRDLLHVDEERRLAYIRASGLERGEDPYLRRLYRVSLDASAWEPKPLTPERADHTVSFSPTGRAFVDVYSRVDEPTRSRVVATAGAPSEVLVELEEADFSRFHATGTRLPVPFEAKARDSATTIYGNVMLPPGFSRSDAAKSYPVIDGIYPGPQVNRVAKNWHEAGSFLRHDLALAQLGFIVVTVDGLGTPFRSKSFHAHSEGNLQEAGGLPDHLAAIRQLAQRYPQMDLDRIGIYGHSGGGFAAARAILSYPDFYKVAVSSAGNHDQRGYLQLWGEHYQGDPASVSYEEQANPSIADRLQGKLLLAYGGLDDNVHPALTLQLIDALIAAGKDYDLIVLPAANHGFMNHPYFTRRMWDYFARHLAGREPPPGYRLATAD